MIIPKTKKDKYEVGDVIINLVNIDCKYCIASVGEKFIVDNIEYSNNNISMYFLRIKDSNIITEEYAGFVQTNFVLDIDINTSRKLYEKRCINEHIYNFINCNCKHKFSALDGYNKYTACKIQKEKYNYCPCDVKFECLQYFDKNQYVKDNIIKEYIRNNKLKKLV